MQLNLIGEMRWTGATTESDGFSRFIYMPSFLFVELLCHYLRNLKHLNRRSA
jgi:hypothetical protein